MMISHDFESRLNIYSLFGALILNSCVLIMFTSTFKISPLKNIMPEAAVKCFQCELIKEALKEEPKIAEIKSVAVPEPLIKEPEPVIEKKIEVIKKMEKKQPKIIKKIVASPKVIETPKVITNEPAPDLVSNINAQAEDLADAGDVLPQTENVSNSEVKQTASQTKGASGTSGTGGVNTNGDIKNALISKIIYLLEKEKFYPHFARKTGITGTVRINFVIDDSGKIISYSLANNEAHKILAEAALETARRVAANPVLTAQLDEKINITVPIRYELKN